MSTLRIATRGSKLALWQAHHVRDRLVAAEPSLTVELVVLKTQGDRVLDRPLAEVGGKGLFVKEIEEALLDGRVDVAVHSLKDLPADLPAGLCLAVFPAREDPRDVLVSRGPARPASELPPRALVGTSSLRRSALLRAGRPDVRIAPIRGNVETRLAQLESGAFDAIILARAGLRRLGLSPSGAADLSVEEFPPAVGQGILAVEARATDGPVLEVLMALDDPRTRSAAEAERAFLRRLGAGCHTPVAGHARVAGDALSLHGLVASADASTVLRDSISGPAAAAEMLGQKLAEELLARGARRVLGEGQSGKV